MSPVGLAAALGLGSPILAAAAIDLDRDAHFSAIGFATIVTHTAISATAAIFPVPLSS